MGLWDFSQFLLQTLGLSQCSQICDIHVAGKLGKKQQQDLDVLGETVLYCHLEQKLITQLFL